MGGANTKIHPEGLLMFGEGPVNQEFLDHLKPKFNLYWEVNVSEKEWTKVLPEIISTTEPKLLIMNGCEEAENWETEELRRNILNFSLRNLTWVATGNDLKNFSPLMRWSATRFIFNSLNNNEDLYKELRHHTGIHISEFKFPETEQLIVMQRGHNLRAWNPDAEMKSVDPVLL